MASSWISSMPTNADVFELFADLHHWLVQCQPHMPEIQSNLASFRLHHIAYFLGTMFNGQVELIVTVRLLHCFQPRWQSPTTKTLAFMALCNRHISSQPRQKPSPIALYSYQKPFGQLSSTFVSIDPAIHPFAGSIHS